MIINPLGLIFLCGTALGAVRMPRWFSDNMVLQTNAEYGARSFLSGRANPGEEVTVTFEPRYGAQVYRAVADTTDGAFEIQLDPNYSRQRYNVTVSGSEGGAGAVAKNVMFGDVFFCSGQSNMDFPIKVAYNSTREMQSLKDPMFEHFRFFVTARGEARAPQWDLSPVNKTSDNCGTPNARMRLCNQWLTVDQALQSKEPNYNASFLASFSAVCFLTVRDTVRIHSAAMAGRPMGLIQSAWGGTRIEAWMSPKAIAATGHFAKDVPKRSHENDASALYNAMVSPWNKFAVRAALWYQGEYNAEEFATREDAFQTAYYSSMLASMVQDWREEKGMGDFAFVAMQLPPSVPAGTPYHVQMGTGFIQIRLAEAVALLPRPGGQTDIGGMAVGIDLGGKSEWGSIHPPNKNEMSRRLAMQVVHVAYAQQHPLWTGPVVKALRHGAGAVAVDFAPFSAQNLTLQDVKSANPDGTRNDCTLCCANAPPFEVTYDGGENWTVVSRENTLLKDSSVVLRGLAMTNGDRGSEGLGVRYAWRDFVECVLYNGDLLPMGPFLHMFNSKDEHQYKSEKPRPKPTSRPLRPRSRMQRPPMGFNSWNFYHCNIDENTVKAIVDAIAGGPLKAAGYEYVNIDDCWQVERRPDGTIQPDPVRFPSGMKALADYAHSRDLKFGVYTAQGSRTCQNRPGAYGFEELDAATYCGWGVDYLKIDNCGGKEHLHANTSWIKFKKAFDECYKETGREIVESVESCGDPDGCGRWIAGVANLWRTSGDIQSRWESVMSNIHRQNRMAPVARPGHFNDPDMLQVGNVGLTETEQYSHMSLWCVTSAPLLAGTDVIHASDVTLDILANPEVTAVNQDLGREGAIQGVIVSNSSTKEVWRKLLSDGDVAVVLLNLGDTPASVTALWADVGLPTHLPVDVRDLWRRKDVAFGVRDGHFTVRDVPSHGVAFLRLSPAADARFVVSVMFWEEVKVWYDDGIHGIGNEIIVAVAAVTAIVLVGYKCLSWAMPRNGPRNNANREHLGIPGRVRPEGEECPICYDTARLAVETNCGHVFCGSCVFQFYEMNNALRAPNCPYCRQRMTLLIPFYSDAERSSADPGDQRDMDEMLEKIGVFNRRYSNLPRSYLEQLRDLPMLLRHFARSVWRNGNGMQILFTCRTIFLLLVVVIYLLSPFDLLPEFVFGLLGLVDDLIIVVMMLMSIATWYRAAVGEHGRF